MWLGQLCRGKCTRSAAVIAPLWVIGARLLPMVRFLQGKRPCEKQGPWAEADDTLTSGDDDDVFYLFLEKFCSVMGI